MDEIQFPQNDWNCRCHYAKPTESYQPFDPMSHKQEYRRNQRIGADLVGGVVVTYYVVSDLTDEAIQDQLRHYLLTEDFEYCAALKAEADRRGLRLKIPKEL